MGATPVTPTPQKAGSGYTLDQLQKLGATPVVSQPPTPPPQREGVLKGFAKSILSPFARTAVSAGRLAQSGVKAVEGDQAGAQEILQKPVNLPFLGETKPFKNDGYVPTEQLGAGLEIGSYGLGGGAVKTVGKEIAKKTFGQAIKQGVKTGAVSGATGGAGAGLEQGDGFGDAVTGAVVGAGVGGAFGAAIPAIASKFAKRAATKADELALLKGQPTNPLPDAPPAPPGTPPSAPTPDARIATKQLNETGQVVTDKVAKEAVRQGVPEADVALIKTGTAADKAKMQKMLSIRESQLTNKRVTERATDVVGDTFLEKIAKPLENENKKARMQLELVAKGLSGKKVDVTPAIEQFSNDLESAGIKEMAGGKLNFKGSDFEGIPGAQTAIKNVYTRLLRLAKTGDAMEAHRIKRYIDEVVDYGKATEGLSGRAQKILKTFRHNTDTVLDNTFSEYNKVNTAYADTINELDKIGQAMGRTFKINGTFADAKAGVVMRRILSNTQSRSDLLQLLESSQNVLKKYGIQMDEDIITQAQFADTLERMIGSEAPTSFLGQIERGIAGAEQATSAATDLVSGNPIRATIKAGKFLIEKTRGVSQENKLKAMRELIKTTEKKAPSNFGKPKTPPSSFNSPAVGETAPKFNSAIEAMNSPKMKAFFDELNAKKKASKVTKTSNNLYHTTSAENLDSIAKNGLMTGQKARFEGVSSPSKISFSANEVGAQYYGKQGDVMIRTKTSYKPADLDIDLLAGGEGAYTTSKNVPPEMLEVKINGKWQSLVDYQKSQKIGKTPSATAPKPVVEKTPSKLSISDAFDNYKYNSDYAHLKQSMEAFPEEAKQVAQQSQKFLKDRGIKTLYRAGSEDGISYSYTKSGAERFAQSGSANDGAPTRAKIIELKITPEVLDRVQIVEGITGSGTRNALGEYEVILRPVKKSNFGKTTEPRINIKKTQTTSKVNTVSPGQQRWIDNNPWVLNPKESMPDTIEQLAPNYKSPAEFIEAMRSGGIVHPREILDEFYTNHQIKTRDDMNGVLTKIWNEAQLPKPKSNLGRKKLP